MNTTSSPLGTVPRLRVTAKRRAREYSHCRSCPEQSTVGTVSGFGPDKARLVIVGEHPGATEIYTQRPFTGPSGELLNATLRAFGIRPQDCYFDNSVMCVCKPLKAHLRSCFPELISRIRSREPLLVLTIGKVAFQAVCETNASLADTDGTLYWQPKIGAWVMPTWHPAAVLRGGADDRFYPRIANAIWRIGRFLDGKDELPIPGAETASFPWTLFRTPEGAEKALRYFKRRADEYIPQPGAGLLTISCDTESRSPGFGAVPDWIYIPESARPNVRKAKGKGRPHAFSDKWIMLQLYDGVRAAAIDVTVQTDTTLALFKELLRHPKIRWVGHNFAGYDTQVFRANLKTAPRDDCIGDTMVLGLGLSEKSNSVGLDPLARTWLNAPAWKKGLKDTGYRHQTGPQNDEHWRLLGKYGVNDAYYTYELDRKLPALVRDEGTAELCEKILLPLAITCGKLSARGFPLDTKQIEKLEESWGGRSEELVSKLQNLAANSGWDSAKYAADESLRLGKRTREPAAYNPRSSRHLQYLAYDLLKLSPTSGSTNRKFSGTAKNLRGRERSVDADFLAGHEDTEFAQLMLKLRIYDKLVRTYVRGLVREIDADGLIHPDFSLAATATGRLVAKPLLQVLPHYGAHSQLEEEDFAYEVRRLFPARPGYRVVTSDYKQLEFRIAWMLSGDKALGRSLMSSDPHATTAAMMFQKPIEVVTKADRHAAKRVGFGVAYNRTAFTLAQGPLLDILGGVEVPQAKRIAEAQKFIDSYWASYPDYRRYFELCKEMALCEGELRTPFGRKRRWMLITDETKRGIENQAVNFPIQSTASDFCSTALIQLARELPKRKLGFPLYTVHDEIVSEIREDRLSDGVACIREIMTNPPLDTGEARFPVDVSYGPSLGELTPWQDAA